VRPLNHRRASYDNELEADRLHDRLAQISEQIDALSHGRRERSRPAPDPLSGIQRSLDDLTDRLDHSAHQPPTDRFGPLPTPQPQYDATLRVLEDLQQKIPHRHTQDSDRGHGIHSDALQQAITEIADTQSMLDRGYAPGRGRPAAGGYSHADPYAEDLKQRFKELADGVAALRGEYGNASLSDLRQELAQMRADLRESHKSSARHGESTASRPDSRSAEALRADIAHLRDSLSGQNVGGSLESLENAYQHIVERLDLLTRALGEAGTMSAIGDRLAEIRSAVGGGPQMKHIDALAARIAAISDQLEKIAVDAGPERLNVLDHHIRDIHARLEQFGTSSSDIGAPGQLQELTDRISSQFAALEHTLTRPTDTNELDAIDRRLADIAGRMANLERSGAPTIDLGIVEARIEDLAQSAEARLTKIVETESSFPAIEKAMASIGDKLENIAGPDRTALSAIEASLSRIDQAMTRSIDPDGFSRLEARLASMADGLVTNPETGSAGSAELRDEVSRLREDVAAIGRLDGPILERGLSELTAQVEQAVATGAGEAIFDKLEKKISQVAQDLSGGTSAPELTALNASIERLIENLDQNNANAAEAARAAAQDAARQIAEQQSNAGQDGMVVALQDDLRKLRAASEASEQQTQGNFAGLQETLKSITARLQTIDSGSDRRPGPSIQPDAVEEPTGERPTSLLDNALSRSTPGHRPVAETPEPPEDHRPLAPGVGRPSLSRPTPGPKLDRGSDRTPNGMAGDQQGGRQTDFIAAARRAAQAAAEEAAAVDETDKPKRRSWLIDKLKRKQAGSGRAEPVEPTSDRTVRLDTALPNPISEPAESEPVESNSADDAVSPPPPDEAVARAAGRSGDGFISRRRPLVLAAAALLIAIGAMQIYKYTRGSQNNVVTATPAVERSMSASGADNGNPNKLPESTRQPASSVTGSGNSGTSPSTKPSSTSVPAARMIIPGTGATSPAPTATTGGVNRLPKADSNVTFTQTVMSPGTTAANEQPTADKTQPSPDTSNNTYPTPPEAIGSGRLRAAASAGDPNAQFEVAVRYTEGRGVSANLPMAARWYEYAANAGLAPAQYRLGSLYEKGRGLAKDITKARIWYNRAADRGNAKAMHNLAVIDAEGAGQAPNFEAAVGWFEKAANLGVRDSQFNLAILYFRGLGVPRDLAASYKWFAIAAKEGDHDAARKRDEVAKTLDRNALAAARMAVETWKPQPLLAPANVVSPPPDGWMDAPATSAGNEPVGETKTLVAKAQSLLNRLGYQPGPADGVIGPRTRDAVRAFQRKEGMPETGVIDPKLVTALDGRTI